MATTKTPDDFYKEYKDRAVCHLSGATSNYQCVCAFKEFLWWCGAGYGQYSHDSVGGNADQLVNGLMSKYAQHFVRVNNNAQIQDGDWVIWAYDGTGHIAMAYGGGKYAFGQNQCVSGVPKGPQGGQKFTLVSRSFTNRLGAWRWKEWKTGVGESAFSSIGMPSTNADESFGVNTTLPVATVDYTKLTPYIVELNRNSPDNADISKLKNNKVVGILVEGGTYFTKNGQKEENFRNPKLDSQIRKAVDNKMPFGLYLTARAKSVDDVKKEMYEFSFLARKYPPSLGAWLKLELQEDKNKNKPIIERYQQEFEWLGLKYKIGFMATEDQLSKQVEWADLKDDWLLWVNNHVKSLSEIDKLLDPMFFDIPYTGVPDTSNAISNIGVSGSGTGKYSDANASEAQKRVVANAKANNGTRAATYGYCAAWVSGIYEKSGLGYPGGDAYTWWTRWRSTGSTDTSNMPLGVPVIFNKSASNQMYGHIGIHVGNGMIAHNKGGVAIQTVQEVAKWTGASVAGWVWANGKVLQQPTQITSTTSSTVAATAGAAIPNNLSGWKSGVASAYGGFQDASIADNQRTATGDAVTESSMGVAIPMAWNRRDLYMNKHKVFIKYNNKIVQATINDCGGMGGGSRALDLQPGVTKAFGVVGASNWGLRTVEYIIQ